MRTTGTILAVVLAGVFFSTPVEAQGVKNGGPKGQIISANLTPVPGSTDATIYTTPAQGFFILTQYCQPFGRPLKGNTFGIIASGNIDRCQTFTPGIALPQGEVLTVDNSCCSQMDFATITGVLSKK
jgi:hypothetical protein